MFNPVFYPTLLQLGKVYNTQFKHSLAKDFYKKANSSCKTCYEPVLALYNLYTQSANYKKAVKLLSKHLSIPSLSVKQREKTKELLIVAKRLQK